MVKKKQYVFHAVTELFPNMRNEDYAELKADIEENGLLEPIWLSKDGKIVDGRHRYRACTELNIEPAFQETEGYEEEDLPALVVSLNLKRRHLNESQRGMLAARMLGIYKAAAEKRMKSGKKIDPSDNCLEGPGKASERAAAVVNVSYKTVERGKKVLEEGISELVSAVDSGVVTVQDAAYAAKLPKTKQKKAVQRVTKGKAKTVKEAAQQMEREEQIKAIAKLEPVMGKFPVVVVDPPWTFAKTREGDPTQRGKTPYPTMSEEELCCLNIPAADDCFLWCWTTNAHLVSGEAIRVVCAWGFEPKGLVTWVKPKMGVGDWLRGQTEHCILAVKGSPTKTGSPPSTVLNAPVRGHSEKPEEFYKMIEEYCPGGKCELFATRKREGWHCHG